MTPVLLAIDAQTPGIGWAVLRMADGVPLDWGWTPLSRDGWLEDRVRECIERTRPEDHGWEVVMVSIERPRGGKGVQSMLTVAEVGGQVAQACRWRWPKAAISRPTPSEWKMAAGLKGNAPKASVAQAAADFTERPEYIERQDVADALVMGLGEWRACQRAVS